MSVAAFAMDISHGATGAADSVDAAPPANDREAEAATSDAAIADTPAAQSQTAPIVGAYASTDYVHAPDGTLTSGALIEDGANAAPMAVASVTSAPFGVPEMNEDPLIPVTEASATVQTTASLSSTESSKLAPRTLGIDPAVAERKKRAQESWERAVAAKESGATLEGRVTTSVKGGLLVDVDGVRGFLPASQASPGAGVAIETLVKQVLPLKIIDVDAARKRVVVSHRRAAESQKRAARSMVVRSLEIGQRFDATVVRLVDFGAFVDIGNGIEGLVPMSELAFERIDKVADLLSVGETFPATLIRIEDGGRKIALSRKSALPDPWRDHADIVRIGATVEGKVVGKEPRLQVEIAPGVIGAVRESDADPAEYEIGETIEVSIRNLDRRTRRITLTTLHGAAAAAVSTPAAGHSGFFTLGEELRARNPKR